MIDYLTDDPDNYFDLSYYGFAGEGFYFWNETEANCYGPYDTKHEAEAALDEYAKTLSANRAFEFLEETIFGVKHER